MFSSILAIGFVFRLSRNSDRYAPKEGFKNDNNGNFTGKWRKRTISLQPIRGQAVHHDCLKYGTVSCTIFVPFQVISKASPYFQNMELLREKF